MTEQIKPDDRVRMVRGRVREAMRLATRKGSIDRAQVLAYFRYVFTDTKKYLNEVSIVQR